MYRDVLHPLLFVGLLLSALGVGFQLGRTRRERPAVDPALEKELRALQASDLELLVQPILLVANPGQFALEVVPRATTPRLRSLDTAQLSALARRLGAACQLDRLVLQALPRLEEQLRREPEVAARLDRICLNLSAESLAGAAALHEVVDQLRRLRIDHRGTTLELSELSVSQPLEGILPCTTAAERIHRELGVRICVDRLGAGLSDFRQIAEGWYDAIKLHPDLVEGLHGSFRLQRFLGAFLGSAHALGKVVGMEGVAEYRDLAAAIRLGADALQGPLIARPMLPGELRLFLARSPWADPEAVQRLLSPLRSAASASVPRSHSGGGELLALERFILANWAGLRSFEEFVLLFVNELRSWGLDTMRLSLAFLPDRDDVDGFQYTWSARKPGEVETLCLGRDVLEQPEHLASPLHYLATVAPRLRRRLDGPESPGFPFLRTLQEGGATDYLGIRLESRGVSIPVLTIALQGTSRFSEEQVQRIESVSALLSLLFHSFESERAKRLALLDPLTQLANRRSFDSFLKANLAACRVAGRTMALLLLDIDRFKEVNDTYGHAHGDHCLRQMAAVLTHQLRHERDFLARLGGEEFAVILFDIDTRQTQTIAERLRACVAALPITHASLGQTHPLTVSIGAAVWQAGSGPLCEAEELQQLADACLYEAKNGGRNRVVCRRVGDTVLGGPIP
ncbi:MAG: GGDEF domain-containing protein [Synechococcaceae cyanobacterium]|nr:GGDEF domain-containing protein [Synechococcaceae cyanobacterium]